MRLTRRGMLRLARGSLMASGCRKAPLSQNCIRWLSCYRHGGELGLQYAANNDVPSTGLELATSAGQNQLRRHN